MAAHAPAGEAGTRGRLPRPGRRRRRAARAARARTPRTEPCAAGGAASAGAGRRRRPSPRSGQPVSLARGCVRLACLAQPGAQGAARQLDNRNGEDPPRPAGRAVPARAGRSMRTGWAAPYQWNISRYGNSLPRTSRRPARRARPAVEHGRAAIAAGTRRSPAAARHFAALRRP
jgi:hypothetical protein